MPVDAILDASALSVGAVAGYVFSSVQTTRAFSILATAPANSQTYTLQPNTIVFATYAPSEVAVAIKTVTKTGINFPITAETRCIIVNGFYLTGTTASIVLTFSFSGSMVFV